jgi:hypothetical protein
MHSLSLSLSVCASVSVFKKIIKKLSFLLLWPACFSLQFIRRSFYCVSFLKRKKKKKNVVFSSVLACLFLSAIHEEFLGGIRKDVFRGF